jgi:hypothetical protein
MADSFWYDAAAWVQAGGTIVAVAGAAWIAAGDARASRRREELIRSEAREREERARKAAKTAALNLAILASTQIHDLHVLLPDEAWRARVRRVSPSRTLLATERLLIAFPIQSLDDARAMVAFAHFPGALDTAAEIYGNLERAVRAASEEERATIFTEYALQMQRLDASTQTRLQTFRAVLGLETEGDVEPPDAGDLLTGP